MAQSVVLETGPQPSPSTATCAPTPANLQKVSTTEAAKQESLCQLWSGEVGPEPPTPAATSPTWNSPAAQGVALTCSLCPMLQPAHLSCSLHITGMCVPLASVPSACSPSVWLSLFLEVRAPASGFPHTVF